MEVWQRRCLSWMGWKQNMWKMLLFAEQTSSMSRYRESVIFFTLHFELGFQKCKGSCVLIDASLPVKIELIPASVCA